MNYNYEKLIIKDKFNTLLEYPESHQSIYTNMGKGLLFKSGINILNDFAVLNNVPITTIELRKWQTNYKGYYISSSNKIYINLSKCSRANPMYSFPGFTSNATAQGVVVHEYGHYINDKILSKLEHSLLYYKNKINEKCVTSYCPDVDEYFAEQLKVFIINPDLLKVFWPNTYNFLSSILQPLNRGSYLHVLHEFVDEIPEKIYKRIEKLKSKK